MVTGWLPRPEVGPVAREPEPQPADFPEGHDAVVCSGGSAHQADDPALSTPRDAWARCGLAATRGMGQVAAVCLEEQAPHRADLAAVVWRSRVPSPVPRGHVPVSAARTSRRRVPVSRSPVPAVLAGVGRPYPTGGDGDLWRQL